ncbi:hypothetical protein K491DRAFT_696501 [Lophiostoma macrostomum CBS 122681]|uniref:Uncharacterized protein n=1 Tax=Lophiostoma macrostomum CBS 122681 TaxID=1314788 RepID=A0A6A6SUE1_9PLEO|nr:hypothetical protein K491DRAFT_696501 [Lophiostoma macrostomum CBS 122681]
MTSCLADVPEDTAVLSEHIAVAKAAQVPFFLFDITCDLIEHEDRFYADERYRLGKSKLSDVDVLANMMNKYKLAIPEWESGVEVSHGPFFDTTGFSAEESAERILSRVDAQAEHLSHSRR